MVCEPGNENKVIQLFDRIAPSNKFVDDSGGSMVFSVPLSSTVEISLLFKLLEDNEEEIKYDAKTDSYQDAEEPLLKELKSLLQDVGISHSTLEEVFMKVTGKKVSKNRPSKDNKVLKKKKALSQESLENLS